MKNVLLIFVLVMSVDVFAQSKPTDSARQKAKAVKSPASVKSESKPSCKAKVESVIRSTARAMGLRSKFGLQLQVGPGGVDMTEEPLTLLSSGVFIVDEGYVSESSSKVVVRGYDSTCEIIKLEVSIGG